MFLYLRFLVKEASAIGILGLFRVPVDVVFFRVGGKLLVLLRMIILSELKITCCLWWIEPARIEDPECLA